MLVPDNVCAVLPAKTTCLLLQLKVPLFDQLPDTLKSPPTVPDSVKVAPELTDTFPDTDKAPVV